MPQSARLIIDPPAAGVRNMAIDEALLRSAPRRGSPTLRLYSWDEPTLSLGYFQRVIERKSHLPSTNCPMVRRSSGGGAIVHDRELTYSYVMPLSGRQSRKSEGLYGAFHDTLIEALSDFGIAARQYTATMAKRREPQPFLCFQRRFRGDLLVGDSKIVGSAQRRHKQGLLQHGSILLARSERAPELPGLSDFASQSIAIDQITNTWIQRLGERLDVEFNEGLLASEELAAVESLSTEKFAHPGWTLRR